jgi:hypothetical protein
MKHFFLFSLLFLSIGDISGQVSENNLAVMLDSFALKNAEEKCYIQTDKSTYFSETSILFKSYFTLFGMPSVLSKVGYVLLTNSEGKVLEKKMLKLKNGSTVGDFYISDNVASGYYYIRAYSLWMLNYPELIFSKKIQILNLKDLGKQKNSQTQKEISTVSFFAEGGQLLNNVENVVGFKAINKNGIPVKIEGEIFNKNKLSVAKVTTTHFGMGSFVLKPQIGEKYTAILKDEFGNNISLNLENAIDEGVTIHVDNLNDKKVFINLNRGEKNKEQFNELILVALQNNKLVYFANLNFDEGLDAVAINKKNISNGIVQITVLTKDGIPLTERLIFINNNTTDSVEKITILKSSFEKRAKNSIGIDLGAYSNPDIALSVVHNEFDVYTCEDNIFSSMYFTNESKELIYKPNSYLISNNIEDKRNIDLLMLTNGWRKYNWKDILEKRNPKILYPFERSLNITGKITKANNITNLKDAKVNFIIKGIDSTTIQSQINISNRIEFALDGLDFEKSATVYYQGTNQNKSEGLVTIKINPHYFDTLKGLNFSKNYEGIKILELNKNQIKSYENRILQNVKTLDSVFVKTKVITSLEKTNAEYVSNYFAESDQTLIPSGNYFDIWQYLRTTVPGITINKAVSGTTVNFNRFGGLDFFNQPDEAANNVQFFLNEVQVSVDLIDAINPLDVALVKIYKGVSGIALGLDRGGIAVYTKKGISIKDWRSKGFDFFIKSGYSNEVTYFNMDYTKYNFPKATLDDRPTLYWNTNLKTKDGKLNVDFYNDDFGKSYKIVLEGIDETGKLIHYEKIIN